MLNQRKTRKFIPTRYTVICPLQRALVESSRDHTIEVTFNVSKKLFCAIIIESPT